MWFRSGFPKLLGSSSLLFHKRCRAMSFETCALHFCIADVGPLNWSMLCSMPKSFLKREWACFQIPGCVFFVGGHYRCLRNTRPTKSYSFIGLGAVDVTKPYKLLLFGDIHGPKPNACIGFRWVSMGVYLADTGISNPGLQLREVHLTAPPPSYVVSMA